MEAWLNGLSGSLNVGLLLFARFSALLFVTPVVSSRNVPRQVRLGLSLFLTLVLVPLATPRPVADAIMFLALLAKEILFGLILGWTAMVIFAAVQIAGEWLDLHAGFQAAHMLNPAFDAQNSLLGNFKHLVAGVLFLGTGAHAIVIRAAASSLTVCPPGRLGLGSGTLDDWTALVTRVAWIAIQLAAPVAGTLFLVEIALGLVHRVLPQVNVTILSLPAKAWLATFALALSVPVMARAMILLFQGLDPTLAGVLKLLAR